MLKLHTYIPVMLILFAMSAFTCGTQSAYYIVGCNGCVDITRTLSVLSGLSRLVY